MKLGVISLAVFMSLLCLRVSPASVNTSYAAAAGAADAGSVYGRHCASCHGRDGRSKTAKGRQSHARNIADAGWQNDVSDERIFNSISNGRGAKMPRFDKKLSENDIDQLVTYVRKLKR